MSSDSPFFNPFSTKKNLPGQANATSLYGRAMLYVVVSFVSGLTLFSASYTNFFAQETEKLNQKPAILGAEDISSRNSMGFGNPNTHAYGAFNSYGGGGS